MNIYVYHRTKNWCPPNTFSETCYGPFKSKQGAKLAAALVQRIDNNTGQYHNTTKVKTFKGEPKHHTITWPNWCSTNKYLDDEYKNYHEIV